MPIIDPRTVELLSPQGLLESYFQSPHRFSLQVRRMLDIYDTLPDALDRARIMQLVDKRPWFIGYREGESSDMFRRSLGETLERIGANFTLYRQGSPVAVPPDGIHLTHHTRGKRAGLRHYKMGYLPQYFYFDRSGYSGWSEISSISSDEIRLPSLSEADSFFKDTVTKILQSKISKYRQNPGADVRQSDFIFFALQVPNDSVIGLCFEKNYVNSIMLCIQALLAAGHAVVAKPHPFGKTDQILSGLARMQANGLIVTDSSIHDLLPNAKAVVTANSGVGFEALLYEKPVLCLAQADYRHAAHEVRNAGKIDEVLETALATHDPGQTRRFVTSILKRYQVDILSRSAMEQHVLRTLCQMHIGDLHKQRAEEIIDDGANA